MLDFAKWPIEKNSNAQRTSETMKLLVTKLSYGPDLFDLKLTKHLFDGIPKYMINLLTWKFVPEAKINRFLRC